MAAPAKLQYDLFVSYSRRDKPFADLFVAAMAQQKKTSWIDNEDIPKGVQFIQEIYEGIEKADAFVFLLSPDSVASQICGLEVAHAVEHNKRIVPVRVRDVAAATVPQSLAGINWVLADAGNPQAAAGEVIAVLETDIAYIKAHTRLLNQALAWEARKGNRSLLLRGSELKAAEEWLRRAAGMEQRATALQSKYVRASRQEATRRARILSAGVAAAAIIAAVLGVIAYFQRDEANKQRNVAEDRSKIALSRQLVTRARSLDSFDTRMLLALAAWDVAPTAEARQLLASELQSSHLEKWIRGQTDFVAGISYNPSGKLIASAGDDEKVYFWNAESGEAMASAPGLRHVYEMSFSSDGSLLALAGSTKERKGLMDDPSPDGTVMLLDTASKMPVAVPASLHATHANGVAFFPGGRTLAVLQRLPAQSSEPVSTVEVWDLAASGETAKLESAEAITVIAAARDGALAAGTREGRVLLWRHIPDAPLALAAHRGPVNALSFSPDGNLLVSGAEDGQTVVWQAGSGERVIAFNDNKPVVSVAFSNGVRSVSSALADGSVWTRDYRTDGDFTDGIAETSFSFPVATAIHMERARYRAAFSPGAANVVVGDCGNLTNYHALSTCAEARIRIFGLGEPGPLKVALGKRRDKPGSGTSADPAGSGRDPALDAMIKELDPEAGHAVSPDGSLLVLGKGNAVDVVDTRSKNTIRTLSAHADTVRALAFSGDGKTIVSGARDGFVVFWDAQTGAEVSRAAVVTGPDAQSFLVDKLVVNSGGSIAAAEVLAGEGNVIFRSWDLIERGATRPFLHFDADQVEFSPDTARVLARKWPMTDDGELPPPGTEYEAFAVELSMDVWRQKICSIVNRTMTKDEWAENLGDRPYEDVCAAK